jgi:hypothetical protein
MNKLYLRDIMYNSGEAFLPQTVKYILETNFFGSNKKTFYISGWSMVHLMNGMIIGFIYLYFRYNTRFYFLVMFIIHTLWEAWQIFIGLSKYYKLSGPNNLVDTIMDTLFFMIGTYIVKSI